jgi:hypothetical protein
MRRLVAPVLLVATVATWSAQGARADAALPPAPPAPSPRSVVGDATPTWARRSAFTVSLPVWVPGVTGTLATGTNEASTDGGFFDRFVLAKDAVTELQFAFVGRLEGTWRRWWGMADLFGARLGSEVDWERLDQDTDVELEALIARAVVGWQAWCAPAYGCAGARIAFTPYVGVRRYDVDLRVNAAQGSRDWIDAIVGLELHWWISPRFTLRVLADVGTGIDGGSDHVWSLAAEVHYRFTRCFSVFLGYSALDVQYDRTQGDRFLMDITLAGPVLGLSFDF